jgi:hypothetical protein
MTNFLVSNQTSLAELSAEELSLVGGGDTTMVMHAECKVDDSGNGQCVFTVSQKED